MKGDSSDEIGSLVTASRAGDEQARSRLFEVLYEDLCRIARRSPYVALTGDPMQGTALANETYIRLRKRFPPLPNGRNTGRKELLRAMTLLMRMISRDSWRKRTAAKRGGATRIVSLGRHEPASPGGRVPSDFLALHEAMHDLSKHNRIWFDVLAHRYFAGRTLVETGRLMGISPRAVKTYRRLGLRWLRARLREFGRQSSERVFPNTALSSPEKK
jgi:RNA polymerase sigma factor (TIGR02999 family)